VTLTPSAADEAAWIEAEQRMRADGQKLADGPRGIMEESIAANRAHRAALYADRARYPVIATQDVGDPLMVIGLPRSGTTLLHGLLAQDPRARSPLRWETHDWSPPPWLDPEADARRIAEYQARTDALPREMLARHRSGPMLPEECESAILTLAFMGMVAHAQFGLEDYTEWLNFEADLGPGFRLHRHALQHLQTFSPGQWWVLKSPVDLFYLDARLAEYPGTRFVWIHRDPAEIMPSLTSLILYIRQMCGLDPDPVHLGARLMDLWARGLDAAMALRAAHPRPEQFVDVHHREVSRDPIGSVRRIYDHYGLTLSAEAETAMLAFMAVNGRGKHGGHDYTAEQFGMTARAVHERFAAYIETFGVETRS